MALLLAALAILFGLPLLEKLIALFAMSEGAKHPNEIGALVGAAVAIVLALAIAAHLILTWH